MMVKLGKKRIYMGKLFVVVAVALALNLILNVSAHAAEAGDIVLGVYFEADDNFRDTIYASYDGEHFYDIATAHESRAYDSSGYPHAGHACPSIMYHNGYFWMISSWNRNDGKFWPVISYSKDLVTWTYPEGNNMLTGTKGISLDSYPYINGTSYTKFDVVAPEWHVASDGSIYIIFSAGYYGAFHGRPTQDRMQAYIVKVNELSASDGTRDSYKSYLWPKNLVFRTGTARRLPITETAGANYIDGALYEESGVTYLFLKKNGLTIQVYTSTNIDDPSSWKLANASIAYGYEGMSVAKLGNTYFGYVDHITGATADGVRMIKSATLDNGWSSPKDISYSGGKRVRHGSVITLKAGTSAWQIAKNLLDAKGVSPSEPIEVSSGGTWIKSGERWWYRHNDGSYTKGGWEQISGKRYLFDDDGWMLTGWQKIGGSWYYLNSSGEAHTGWLDSGGKRYFLSPSQGGKMVAGTTWEVQDVSYDFDASGALIGQTATSNASGSVSGNTWKQSGGRWWYRHADGSYTTSGWEKINDKWYLFDDAGWMLTGWQKTGGKWYYLSSSGAMKTGWLKDEGSWYHLSSSGAMDTGWLKDKDKWYFLSASQGGKMVAGTTWEIGDKVYTFNTSGALVENENTQGSDTSRASWKQSGGRWWYRHADGSYTTSGWEKINDKWYLFDDAGWMLTGWQKTGGKWYYLSSSGAMKTGWQRIGDEWYYLSSSGAMLASTTTPDGYYVDENGRWIP